jgi:hypothetical protein
LQSQHKTEPVLLQTSNYKKFGNFQHSQLQDFDYINVPKLLQISSGLNKNKNAHCFCDILI